MDWVDISICIIINVLIIIIATCINRVDQKSTTTVIVSKAASRTLGAVLRHYKQLNRALLQS